MTSLPRFMEENERKYRYSRVRSIFKRD